MRRLNGWLTIFWIAMIPVSIAFGLLSSVAYVSALSLWALVSGHWSAWQAARVEVQQQADAKALEDNPLEERVVAKILNETEVNPSPGVTRHTSTEASNDHASSDTAGSETSVPQHVSGADRIPADLGQQLAELSDRLSALRAQIDR